MYLDILADAMRPEKLPPFSGPKPACPKCGLPRGNARGAETKHCRIDATTEYALRTCNGCGYEWPERCADADQAPCPACGGWNDSLIGPKCQACVRYEWAIRGSATGDDSC